MAIARSEPFRERACPLGVCDGSGWILGPEDVARPCECREARLKRGRNKGVASVIPPRFRGVGFDRPPVSDMARDLEIKGAVNEVQAFVDSLDEKLETGRGLWLFGDTGTGKTTLAMLISKAGPGGGELGRDLFAPQAAGAYSPDLRGRAGKRFLFPVLRPPHLSRPSPYRRPRRRETVRLGPRAALRADQRALRDAAFDPDHDESPPRGTRRADWCPHGVAFEPDLRPGRAVRQRPPLRQSRGRLTPCRRRWQRRPGRRERGVRSHASDRGRRYARHRRLQDNLALMPGLVIVGAQWGDEGKGKVTDLLADRRR